MASLLAPAQGALAGPGRISQLLPTVKCSNCNDPVPLAELGEHVCSKPPPMPTTTAPASGGLSLRLQNLISPLKPNSIPMPGSSPSRTPSPQLTPTTKNHRTTPSTASSSSDRSRKTSASSLSLSPFPSRPDRADTTSPSWKDHTPPVSSPLRERAPSMASISSRARTLSTTSNGSIPSARPSFSSSRSGSSPTPVLSSSPTPMSRGPSPAPSSRTPSPQPPRQPQLPPPQMAPPPTPPQLRSPPRQLRQPSIGAPVSPPTPTGPTIPSINPVIPKLGHQPSPSVVSNADIPDTKIGGEAGFAGVGRRGFAALAYSAVFIAPYSDSSIQSRRENAPVPRHLDINAALMPTTTPPLTPASGYSSTSPGPVSPTHSPLSAHPPSQNAQVADMSVSPVSPGARLPMPFFDKMRNKQPGNTDAPDLGPRSRTSSSSSRQRTRSDASLRDDVPDDPDSGSEYGLAYADSTDDEDDQILPLSSKNSDRLSKSNNKGKERAMSTAPLNVSRQSTSSAGSRYSRTSSVSSGAVLGGLLGSNPVTMSRLDKAMETLLEENASAEAVEKAPARGKYAFLEREASVGTSSGNKPARSNTVGVTYSSPDTKPIKLPARARTERDGHRSTDPHRSSSKRIKACTRCEKRIEDGRWIPVDSGGTLCEQCWKNMYLPKCRRCSLPIEKQAVSSSDGQLKGKYHKDCFNCHICHTPFPDRSFYVFDGKPLCGYHYHEQNRSLCAAPTCGQPIEGPCAVSHTGDRYHPNHLSCEFEGCRKQLDEYWEADGLMLCAVHARWAEDGPGSSFADKATKRVTRFIDLSGLR
ncbi:hypothetical protein CYLTODRAFT_379682 [Cylindrobasidium torrendii FP15055 ss-10]|uniref:LIM zinc-binding domain-containing protein n=1 Tax=Cylindrobasidium torrendii FP15055 ss-10 TaxID=1314674 RepID=A0A0D7B548_9AGAR|nr:hypothetical protein CYLTODRAFT_379682 [Cylindrobasidium torrendii FP15055 ss-10]